MFTFTIQYGTWIASDNIVVFLFILLSHRDRARYQFNLPLGRTYNWITDFLAQHLSCSMHQQPKSTWTTILHPRQNSTISSYPMANLLFPTKNKPQTAGQYTHPGYPGCSGPLAPFRTWSVLANADTSPSKSISKPESGDSFSPGPDSGLGLQLRFRLDLRDKQKASQHPKYAGVAQEFWITCHRDAKDKAEDDVEKCLVTGVGVHVHFGFVLLLC